MAKRPRKKRKGSTAPPSSPNPRSRNLGVLIEALRSDVQQVAEGHEQLAAKIDGVRTELKADLHEKFSTLATAITATRQELAEVRTDLHETRDGLRADVQTLQTELHETRDGLRADMQTLQTELHETRDDLRADMQALQTELHETRDELRQEIQATREEVRTHTHTP